MELLSRAVESLRAGTEPDLEKPLNHGPEINLNIAALMPDDYIPDVHMRLILYKRISAAENDESLRELQVEMIDRFGLLPDATKTLFRVTRLKLAAQPMGIGKIEAGPHGGYVQFGAQPNIDPMHIISLVQSDSRTYRFDGQTRLRFSMDLDEDEERFTAVEELLRHLAGTENLDQRA
jgi:transcription-repair coupling factor (superfamily II helicase)